MSGDREVPVTDGTTSAGSASQSNSSSNKPYVLISHASPPSASHDRPNTWDAVYDGLNRGNRRVEKATKQAEIMVGNFWNHVRVSTSVADAAVARIVQGAKLLAKGGHDKLFQQTFGFIPEEKLLKAYACYVSTTTRPVIGTLYISTKRLAFCSDYPISLQHHRIYHKVVVQLDQVSTVGPSANILNPAEKYIQVVTLDGSEFYFMGFISYDKALKTLNLALQLHPNHSNGNQMIPVE